MKVRGILFHIVGEKAEVFCDAMRMKQERLFEEFVKRCPKTLRRDRASMYKQFIGG